jgi:chemotaxis protein CheC
VKARRGGRPKARRAKAGRGTGRPRPGRRGTRRPWAETDLTRFHTLSEAGARNAATALSQILGRPLRLSVPWVRVLPLEKVKEMAGGASRVVCALSLKVYGEARGSLLVVFGREQLPVLLDMVVPAAWAARPGNGDGHGLNDMERSALMEIGNILACAYLNALSHLLGVSLLPSIPGLAVDMLGAVTDHLLIELAAVSDSAMVLASQVLEPSSGLKGSIFFLPHPSTLTVLGRAHVRAGLPGDVAALRRGNRR